MEDISWGWVVAFALAAGLSVLPIFVIWRRLKAALKKLEYCWRVTLISFRENISVDVRTDLRERLEKLAAECGGAEAGIVHYRVDFNQHTRDFVDLVVVIIFKDGDARYCFKEHATFRALDVEIRKVADIKIGEFYSTLPQI
jgi:hypothetical protein